MVDTETLDVACELLADSRRRTVLFYFRSSEVGSIEELSEEIVDREREESPETVSDEVRQEVGVSLVHNHLPHLDSHGVIEFDVRSGAVVRSDAYQRIRPIVERAHEIESDDALAVDSPSPPK